MASRNSSTHLYPQLYCGSDRWCEWRDCYSLSQISITCSGNPICKKKLYIFINAIQLTYTNPYLKPNASRCSSSSHIERLRTCRMRSRVSWDNRMWAAFRPRKNVLYSNAETMAIKSLKSIIKEIRLQLASSNNLLRQLTLAPGGQSRAS